MKKTVIVLLMIIPFFGFSQDDKEKESIKKVIETAYVDGLFNESNVDAIKKGWYFDCDIMVYIPQRDVCYKNPAYGFVVRAEKGGKGLHPGTTFKIPYVHVTGYAAIAIVEIFQDGKQKYTDYMNLYKFKDGWKIATKTYYEHE